MKTFIKPLTVAVMLLFAGASFAQTSHPPVHHHYKHHKHHKHHKKHYAAHYANEHPAQPVHH